MLPTLKRVSRLATKASVRNDRASEVQLSSIIGHYTFYLRASTAVSLCLRRGPPVKPEGRCQGVAALGNDTSKTLCRNGSASDDLRTTQKKTSAGRSLFSCVSERRACPLQFVASKTSLHKTSRWDERAPPSRFVPHKFRATVQMERGPLRVDKGLLLPTCWSHSEGGRFLIKEPHTVQGSARGFSARRCSRWCRLNLMLCDNMCGCWHVRAADALIHRHCGFSRGLHQLPLR